MTERVIEAVTMGDSRICSRGFPEVVHGALARRKNFHFYHAHFSYAPVIH